MRRRTLKSSFRIQSGRLQRWQSLHVLWWMRYKFKSNTAKYAEKANHRLVALSSLHRKAAHSVVVPLTKAPLLNWPCTKVGFCCNNCKGKFTSAGDDAAKDKLVFSDKAFKKAFAKKEVRQLCHRVASAAATKQRSGGCPERQSPVFLDPPQTFFVSSYSVSLFGNRKRVFSRPDPSSCCVFFMVL